MNSIKYYRSKVSNPVSRIDVGGSLIGRIPEGVIDFLVSAAGKGPGVAHNIYAELKLDAAEGLARAILREVVAVRKMIKVRAAGTEKPFKFIPVVPVSSKVLQRLDRAIQESSHHSKTANFFYHLRERLQAGKPLTKKMQQNLAWIEKEVEGEKS